MGDLISWLEGLKGGAPQVVGAVIGSLLGFVALVFGALFNAKLNRDRDNRLRKVEIRAIAAAIRAELGGLEDSLTDNAKRLTEDSPTDDYSFFIPDLTHSVHVFPKMIEKLGLLGDPAIIADIIGTYIVVNQYCENLLVAGGRIAEGIPEHRRLILMPHQRAEFVSGMNTELAKRLKGTMNSLNRFLN